MLVKPPLTVILLLAAISIGQAMTVEEAYQAIPHGRTVFNPSNTQAIPAEEVSYLQQLFDWVDQGIVAKMSTYKGTPIETAYKKVWEMEKKLQPPERLKDLQKISSQAIHDEYAYLKEWQASASRAFDPKHPKVQSASGAAHQAYNQLMATYPTENEHNKQAFFDYYCALDFL